RGPMARDSRGLVDRLSVPCETEPSQAVENGVDRRLGRALAIGVFDPQQHAAAVRARKQPVEQRGARAADVEKAGGRRREAGNDSLGYADDNNPQGRPFEAGSCTTAPATGVA